MAGDGPAAARALRSALRGVDSDQEIGRLVAERAKEKGISRVVFDRGSNTAQIFCPAKRRRNALSVSRMAVG